jgi:hypothetical protein
MANYANNPITYRYSMDRVSIPLRYTETETDTDTNTRPRPDKTFTKTNTHRSALEEKLVERFGGFNLLEEQADAAGSGELIYKCWER